MCRVTMGPRCRLCLAKIVKGQVVNIFTHNLTNSKDSLVHVLSQVFAVEINAADQFGKDVCIKCIKIIEYVLFVRNTFQMSQEDLRKSIINERNKESPEVKLKDNYENPHMCEPSCDKPSDVRVSLENLQAMCQVSVDLTRWENSLDNMSYRKLSNGAYKPRKRRYFKFDDKLINDICSSLDDNREVGLYNLSKDIGTNTDASLNTCDCENEKLTDTYDFTNILDVRENIPPSCLKKAEKVQNRLELIRNVSTNTLNWKGTGVEENTVRVGIQDLCKFAQPKVVLEPVEHLIRREKYGQIGRNCYYIKRDRLNNESDNHYGKNRNSQRTKKLRLTVYDNELSPLRVKRRRLKSKRKNTEKSNMTPTNNFNSERLNERIVDNSGTESASEVETEIGYDEHVKKAVEPRTQTSSGIIPWLIDHNYGKHPVEVCENFIDSSTNYKAQQSNSNTKKAIASRLKRQQVKKNRFLKNFKKVTPTPENGVPQQSYIWERNCLGKYSAINFYKQSSANTSNISSSQSKKDLFLDETISKLAGRLDDGSTGTNEKSADSQ